MFVCFVSSFNALRATQAECIPATPGEGFSDHRRNPGAAPPDAEAVREGFAPRHHRWWRSIGITKLDSGPVVTKETARARAALRSAYPRHDIATQVTRGRARATDVSAPKCRAAPEIK
jgi:hypothetical protein